MKECKTPSTEQEYLDLVGEMKRHCRLYYAEDDPEITDAEYDAMTRALKRAEAEHPDWAVPDSPARTVGKETGAGLGKTKHVRALLSLDDLFDKADVKAWWEAAGCPEVGVEPKIDGLTMALTYRDGAFALAATRGDGTVGEVVTDQARNVRDVPMGLRLPPEVAPGSRLVVRVEVYQPVAEFERCNRELEAAGAKLLKNPRNAAAGGLRTQNTSVARRRGLAAFAFQIVHAEGFDAVRGDDQASDLALLDRLGFRVVRHVRCRDWPGIEAAIDMLGHDRPALPYWTDGAVVKTEDRERQAELGETAKYPLHAVAYKYPTESRTVRIKSISVTVGRTGRLTPVAGFDPVGMGGTSVSRATLHNQGFVDRNQIDVGADVEIVKSGEIIPKVVSVPVPAARPFRIRACPVCGTPAVGADDDTDMLVCPNVSGCPAQKLRYFTFFCSRDVMDIRGMGPAAIETLLEAGLLDDVSDIYKLESRADEIAALPGLGKKKAAAIAAAVEKSRHNPVDRLVKALGIPGVGRHVGRALAAKYPTLDAAFEADGAELALLDGIGPVLAENIVAFRNDPDAFGRYLRLKAAGCNVISGTYVPEGVNSSASNAKDRSLTGLVFVITGTLQGMSREEASAFVRDHGGKTSGSVSGRTSYLVAGDAPGGKLAKARELGVPVIDEAGLRELAGRRTEPVNKP